MSRPPCTSQHATDWWVLALAIIVMAWVILGESSLPGGTP